MQCDQLELIKCHNQIGTQRLPSMGATQHLCRLEAPSSAADRTKAALQLGN